MYVFAHNSEAGEHATISQSIHGEDLPFVFGAPLGNAGPFSTHFNAEERLLSEAVMRYFSNFAKTGNPTVPWNHRFNNLNPIDWDKYDVDWQEFNEINQNYLLLGTQPIVSQRYRHKYTKYWNEGLLETMRNANSLNQYGKFSNAPATPRNIPLMPTGQVINMYPIKVEIENPTEDPLRELRYRLHQQQHRDSQAPYLSSLSTHEQTFGTAITSSASSSSSATESINYEPISDDEILTSEATTMYLLITVIVTFLLINMMGLFIYLYRRNKKINRKYDNANIFDAVSDDKRSKFNEDDSFILDILRKSSNNTYESVKRHSPINGYGINRQTSTSTVDTHMKVNDWISNEITKCTSLTSNGHITHSKQNSFSTSNSNKKEKVNVAIDATPQARSNSILRQEPIEVTKAKSLDYGSNMGKIICQEVEMDVTMIDEIPFRGIYDNNLNDNNSIDEKHDSDTSSCSCSSFSQCCEECAINDINRHDVGTINMPYHQIHPHDEIMTSFIDTAPRFGDFINVTSRDSLDSPQSLYTPLSPEESLKAIQKMNYPKVLPSYPEHVQLNDATKRRSLQVPPQYYQIHESGNTWDNATFNRQNSSSSSSSSSRPEPPPRLSSTLGRRQSRNEDRSSHFMTKPLKAEEPPPSLEFVLPTVPTEESTLIVGPIIPKAENIYMTMQRKKSISRQNSTSSSSYKGNQENQVPEDNTKMPLNCATCEVDNKNDERFNDTPIYSEIIKNSRVQTPQDGIYSITSNASCGNKHLERKSSANSQESNSSSSSESSTGTIKKIN